MNTCKDIPKITEQFKKEKLTQIVIDGAAKQIVKQTLKKIFSLNVIASIIAGIIIPTNISTNEDLFNKELSVIANELNKENPDQSLLLKKLAALKDAANGMSIEKEVDEQCLQEINELIILLDNSITKLN